MQHLDVPELNRDCVKRYPHLQDLYLTPVILAWGKIPYTLTGDENKIQMPLLTTHYESDDTFRDYVGDSPCSVSVDAVDFDLEMSSDVVVHRGECREFLHYRQGEVLEDVSVSTELIIRAFALEKLRRFAGIVSVRTIDKAIYSISLKPNQNIVKHYSESMHKSYLKYYKSKS
jgi:hypothetical protein